MTKTEKFLDTWAKESSFKTLFKSFPPAEQNQVPIYLPRSTRCSARITFQGRGGSGRQRGRGTQETRTQETSVRVYDGGETPEGLGGLNSPTRGNNT